jgi:hypothetical protein
MVAKLDLLFSLAIFYKSDDLSFEEAFIVIDFITEALYSFIFGKLLAIGI